ncbi:MAG: Crp/Fnr family transcriptional regulator [Bdellovibrio sp.]|nr:Crp/Fnr family transcriptional regulator [Bdellovibrio sp.]
MAGHYNYSGDLYMQQHAEPNITSFLSTADIPYDVASFNEGEILFKEGDQPAGLYLMKSGCVKMFVNRDHNRGRTTSPEYVTKLLSPGEVFGYKSLVFSQPNLAYAKAIRKTTVWIYKKEAIMQLLGSVHPLIKNILEQAVLDIRGYEKTSQLHYLASVQERIAYQLVVLSDRFGVKTDRGISLNLKLTRNEFAQLASTINESLSRHLTEFKNEGLIDLNGKEIIILNREGLAEKSGNF